MIFFQNLFRQAVAFFTAIFITLPSFYASFLPHNLSKDFKVESGSFSSESITLNGKAMPVTYSGDYDFSDGKVTFRDKFQIDFANGKCDWFNYFAILYTCDAFLKCEITYKQQSSDRSEEFFLEPAYNNGEFYSLIDDYLIKKKSDEIVSVSFQPLNQPTATVTVDAIATFNRKVEEKVIYTQNDFLKIGINLDWGGALSYLEDLDSNVEAIKKDGVTKVDSNASKRYGKLPVNKRVNLLNCNDSGRLVQQSYYGGDSSYERAEYMGNKWLYNPVQGGNQYNESSKIVDFKYTSDYIYVKCRPLDWAKSKEFIAPCYIEARYSLDKSILRAECGVIDFSGYAPLHRQQEMPAFYCIEPLNRFYYVKDGEVTCKSDLIFWPDAGYPTFNSSENWIAFAGEFSDSFGVGLYTPDSAVFLAGVLDRDKAQSDDPSNEYPTSYAALVKELDFCSYKPITYSFCLTTGSIDEIRTAFSPSSF